MAGHAGRKPDLPYFFGGGAKALIFMLRLNGVLGIISIAAAAVTMALGLFGGGNILPALFSGAVSIFSSGLLVAEGRGAKRLSRGDSDGARLIGQVCGIRRVLAIIAAILMGIAVIALFAQRNGAPIALAALLWLALFVLTALVQKDIAEIMGYVALEMETGKAYALPEYRRLTVYYWIMGILAGAGSVLLLILNALYYLSMFGRFNGLDSTFRSLRDEMVAAEPTSMLLAFGAAYTFISLTVWKGFTRSHAGVSSNDARPRLGPSGLTSAPALNLYGAAAMGWMALASLMDGIYSGFIPSNEFQTALLSFLPCALGYGLLAGALVCSKRDPLILAAGVVLAVVRGFSTASWIPMSLDEIGGRYRLDYRLNLANHLFACLFFLLLLAAAILAVRRKKVPLALRVTGLVTLGLSIAASAAADLVFAPNAVVLTLLLVQLLASGPLAVGGTAAILNVGREPIARQLALPPQPEEEGKEESKPEAAPQN